MQISVVSVMTSVDGNDGFRVLVTHRQHFVLVSHSHREGSICHWDRKTLLWFLMIRDIQR